MIVCNQEHRFLVAEQMRNCGVGNATIMLEPVGRNSAPAITAAAIVVAETDPDAVIWMMAADAVIDRDDALMAALDRAMVAARAGRIVTFGMKPHRAETAYGYIEVGEELKDAPGVHAVARFLEKPNATLAAELAASGKHLWNSGMFVFTAATLLSEMERYAPEVVEAARLAVEKRTHDPRLLPARPGLLRRLARHQPRLRDRRADLEGRRDRGRPRLVRRR